MGYISLGLLGTIRQKHDLIDPNQVYVDVELPQELKDSMGLKSE